MEYGLEHFIDLIGLGLVSSSMLSGGKFSMLFSFLYLPRVSLKGSVMMCECL